MTYWDLNVSRLNAEGTTDNARDATRMDRKMNYEDSAYSKLAPTKRGLDILVTDFNKLETLSRVVMNYNKDLNKTAMAVGQQRAWLEKGLGNVGSYMETIENERSYIIETATEDKFQFDNVFVRECNLDFNFIDVNKNFYSYKCASGETSNNTLKVEGGATLLLGNKVIGLIMQGNSDTKKVKLGQRIMFDENQVYRVMGWNTIRNTNLMELQMELDIYNPEKDKLITIGGFDYWIADYDGHNEQVGYAIELAPSKEYMFKSEVLDIEVTRLFNNVPQVTTFTFSVDASSTANIGDYDFSIVDGTHFDITNIKGTMETVVIKIVDDGALVADEFKTYTLGV